MDDFEDDLEIFEDMETGRFGFSKIDLGSQHIRKWRSMLSSDIKVAIPDDAGADVDDIAQAIASEIVVVGPMGCPGLMKARADKILKLGSARRIRILSWAVKSMIGSHEKVVKLVKDFVEDDDDTTSEGGEVVDLFRSDLDRLVGVASVRHVVVVSSKDTADVVMNGAREYERKNELSKTGGARS